MGVNVGVTANPVYHPYTAWNCGYVHCPCTLSYMTTISADARADLILLRQQTNEVRAALANTHRLGAARSATVLRLRDAKVPFRVIAAAMGGSVAAVQGILDRAEQRVTPPTVGGGAVGSALPAAALGAGTALTAGVR